jgi:predicted HicB family RNase H-like nuclease
MPATMPQEPAVEERRITSQIRVEPELWARAREAAKRRRMSLNSYLLVALERQVEEDEGRLRKQ